MRWNRLAPLACTAVLLLAGCMGAPSSTTASKSASEQPASSAVNGTAATNGTSGLASDAPLEVHRYAGNVSGLGSQVVSFDPSQDGAGNMTFAHRGPVRFELGFTPSPTVQQLQVLIVDMGTINATTHLPQTIAQRSGPSPIVIDLTAAQIASAKQPGYEVFLGNDSVSPGTAYHAAASVFAATIPPTYTALNSST